MRYAVVVSCWLGAACNAPGVETDATTADADPVDAASTDAADIDAIVDAQAIDAPTDATPDAETSPCTVASSFSLGPNTSTNVEITRSGSVLYAVYNSFPGLAELWFSATAMDGQAITSPIMVSSSVETPQSIAVNGSRILVLGSDHVQPLELDGSLAGTASDAPSGGTLVSGPTTGFRILFSVACPAYPCNADIKMQSLDRDGVATSTATLCAAGAVSSVATAPDGSAVFGATRTASIGPCHACQLSGVGTLPAGGGCQYVGDVEPTPGVTTSRPSVANDGSTIYVSWAASGFTPIDSWLGLGRFPGTTSLARINRADGLIAASSGGHGAALYRTWQGELLLTRFTDDGASIAFGSPCSLGTSSLPPWLFAIDADHVVVIDEHAQARTAVLP